MTRHIDTATLREWLEQDRPVTVVDIRSDDDPSQWAIPGSVHINAYDALREGEAGPLRDAVLPPDRSRARQLADEYGAQLVLPAQNRAKFPFKAIADGDQLGIGAATLRAVHTPGHTDESMVYLLNGEAMFSGDTLFVDGVGRPDLHAGADGARARAGALFHSLSRLRTLPPQVLVLPAHTAHPVAFDGRAIQRRLGDIDQWLSAWLVSEDAFIERVTSRIPATPPNFSAIVGLNEAGKLPEGDPTELEAGANRCAIS